MMCIWKKVTSENGEWTHDPFIKKCMTTNKRLNFSEKKEEWIALAILTLLCILTLSVIFIYVIPPDYNNLGGMHIWLSGSTIKFVNEWLKDGVYTDFFTFFESPASIEYPDLSSRSPYCSYPTFWALGLYFAARLRGLQFITVSFLKKYALLCFMTESILLAWFAYYWFRDAMKCSWSVSVIPAFFTSIFWSILPVNVWFQINVFWVDQAVVLPIFIIILLEYLDSRKEMHATSKRVICALKAAVIIAGILTEYYFWTFIFLLFLVKIIRMFLEKEAARDIIIEGIWYALPVAIGLGLFFLQLVHTPDFFFQLRDRFSLQTGENEQVNLYHSIYEHFRRAIADQSDFRAIIIMAVVIVTFLLAAVITIKNNGFKSLFMSPASSVLIVGLAAPIIQITLLKHHAANHEYPMTKVSWCLAMTIPVMSLVVAKLVEGIHDKRMRDNYAQKNNKPEKQIIKTDICFSTITAALILVLTTGQPFCVKHYLEIADYRETHTLAEIVHEHAEYNDVYYSFTSPIKINPPESLSVSMKEVHQIDAPQEIDSLFPSLPPDAGKILVIHKTFQPDQDSHVKTDEKLKEIRQWEGQLSENGINIYEDDSFVFIKLSH